LVTGGGVQPFDGDLDDYQKWLLEQSRDAAKAQKTGGNVKAAVAAKTLVVEQVKPPEDRKAASQARNQRSELAKPLRKELSAIDGRMGVLFEERDALEKRLSEPKLAPSDMADNGKRLKQVLLEIETSEARWLELSTQLDEMAALG